MFEVLNNILFRNLTVIKEDNSYIVVLSQNREQIIISFKSEKSKLNFNKLRKSQENMCIDNLKVLKHGELEIIFNSIKDKSLICFCSISFIPINKKVLISKEKDRSNLATAPSFLK
jgi:hypothetical protein